MLFDTHAHYDNRRFDSDRDDLIASLNAAGVRLVLNPGHDLRSSLQAVEFAERYDFFYAAVGVHPDDADEVSDADYDAIESLITHPKVRAIGEIGLDYFHDTLPRDLQRQHFRRQMDLARRYKKPAIVHDREAHGDCLTIVDEFPDVKGVFHCFSGSVEYAKELVRRGWSVSFTGSVTFKNAAKLPEVARWLPDDRIMVETDAPYLSPEPVRGRRNSSLNLVHIAEHIAALRGCGVERFAELTTENGKRLFGIE